jgi:BirA family biotin operon repressor/biotin-[acetyl-CoA-carboxylase] ligase
VIMLALGLAAQEALAQTTGLAVDLRWPNDVMLGEKKCAGILAQLEGSAVIAGIGVNVGHSRFPPEIAPLATSLRIAGARVAREELLVTLLESIDEHAKLLSTEGREAVLRMFTHASSYANSRRVRIERDGAILEGTTCGLDASGFLRVREDNGKETTIFTGGVRPA